MAISDHRGRRCLWLGLLVVAAMLIAGCSRFFFLPEPGHRWDPAQAGIDYENIWFDSLDGTPLHGWFLPADEPRGTILFLHGNAENISTHIGAVYWLPGQGYNVFLLDYRGFGLSAGTPDFDGVHMDAAAALARVARHRRVDPERIVVFGQSLGASVAITTVANHGAAHGVRGLIADSPFSSYRGIAREKFGELWLTWPFQWPLSLTIDDDHAPIDHVASVSPIPLLLIAGDDDRVVPSHHSQDLYAAAQPPKDAWHYRGVGHTQAVARDNVRRRLVAWLDGVLGPVGGDDAGEEGE
ncbi:alpha/beta hydrolase [Aquisalimonas asiatica]|nr:alpha/beta hydrolase [Aquisalimonas asiatica]